MNTIQHHQLVQERITVNNITLTPSIIQIALSVTTFMATFWIARKVMLQIRKSGGIKKAVRFSWFRLTKKPRAIININVWNVDDDHHAVSAQIEGTKDGMIHALSAMANDNEEIALIMAVAASRAMTKAVKNMADDMKIMGLKDLDDELLNIKSSKVVN